MDTFAGYIADEKVHESRNKIIYRGHHGDDPHRVMIKVLKTRHPSSSEVARFKQEFSELARLDMPGVVRMLELVTDDHGFAMVEADVGGASLKTRMNGEKAVMDDFLEKALALARIMGTIHKNKLIHMDIKHSNIIVNGSGKDLHITDFGLSAMLTHANDELYHADVVSGSLLYMSPEMTGRMNRSVDYRTDMYSLGVLFYQMVTGDVPFKFNDPMEMIHAHIARPPTPPVELNPALPVVISDMILKLLAKTPEERYQNCFGLAADLKTCLHQFRETGRVNDFPLAGKDFPIKFHVPQILVGREDELKRLLGAFEAARESTGEIMLVLGRPGIGKSALINEIHKPIVAKKGYFLFGKFDQFKKEVPYSAIIQAFQGFMRQILAESETRLHVWRKDLNHALGANAKVISAVIPELELILGEQPPVPELPPEESQNRFNLVFRSFIRVFTTKDRLLSIFIDDLQWADMASLKLIKTIMTGYEVQSLFFIGAYRDNEVQDHHPLSIT